jgi:hypothetical protein
LASTAEIWSEDSDHLLKEQLRFQRRWQIISMLAYVVSTVGTLLCTSAASLLAASHFEQTAAVLAALSTVLIGVEKSLLFREKWKFHLTMHNKLKLLQADIATGQVDPGAAGKRPKPRVFWADGLTSLCGRAVVCKEMDDSLGCEPPREIAHGPGDIPDLAVLCR